MASIDPRQYIPGCESYTKAEEIKTLQKYLKKGISKRDENLAVDSEVTKKGEIHYTTGPTELPGDYVKVAPDPLEGNKRGLIERSGVEVELPVGDQGTLVESEFLGRTALVTPGSDPRVTPEVTDLLGEAEPVLPDSLAAEKESRVTSELSDNPLEELIADSLEDYKRRIIEGDLKDGPVEVTPKDTEENKKDSLVTGTLKDTSIANTIPSDTGEGNKSSSITRNITGDTLEEMIKDPEGNKKSSSMKSTIEGITLEQLKDTRKVFLTTERVYLEDNGEEIKLGAQVERITSPDQVGLETGVVGIHDSKEVTLSGEREDISVGDVPELPGETVSIDEKTVTSLGDRVEEITPTDLDNLPGASVSIETNQGSLELEDARLEITGTEIGELPKASYEITGLKSVALGDKVSTITWSEAIKLTEHLESIKDNGGVSKLPLDTVKPTTEVTEITELPGETDSIEAKEKVSKLDVRSIRLESAEAITQLPEGSDLINPGDSGPKSLSGVIDKIMKGSDPELVTTSEGLEKNSIVNKLPDSRQDLDIKETTELSGAVDTLVAPTKVTGLTGDLVGLEVGSVIQDLPTETLEVDGATGRITSLPGASVLIEDTGSVDSLTDRTEEIVAGGDHGLAIDSIGLPVDDKVQGLSGSVEELSGDTGVVNSLPGVRLDITESSIGGLEDTRLDITDTDENLDTTRVDLPENRSTGTVDSLEGNSLDMPGSSGWDGALEDKILKNPDQTGWNDSLEDTIIDNPDTTGWGGSLEDEVLGNPDQTDWNGDLENYIDQRPDTPNQDYLDTDTRWKDGEITNSSSIKAAIDSYDAGVHGELRNHNQVPGEAGLGMVPPDGNGSYLYSPDIEDWGNSGDTASVLENYRFDTTRSDRPETQDAESPDKTRELEYLDTDTRWVDGEIVNSESINKIVTDYTDKVKDRIGIDSHDPGDKGLGIPLTQETENLESTREQGFIDTDTHWVNGEIENFSSIKEAIDAYDTEIHSRLTDRDANPGSTGLGIPKFKATENPDGTREQEFIDTDTRWKDGKIENADSIKKSIDAYDSEVHSRITDRKPLTPGSKALGIPESQETEDPGNSRKQSYVDSDENRPGFSDSGLIGYGEDTKIPDQVDINSLMETVLKDYVDSDTSRNGFKDKTLVAYGNKTETPIQMESSQETENLEHNREQGFIDTDTRWKNGEIENFNSIKEAIDTYDSEVHSRITDRDSSGPESTGLGIPGFKATENLGNSRKQSYVDSDENRPGFSDSGLIGYGEDTKIPDQVDINSLMETVLKDYVDSDTSRNGFKDKTLVAYGNKTETPIQMESSQETENPYNNRKQGFFNTDTRWEYGTNSEGKIDPSISPEIANASSIKEAIDAYDSEIHTKIKDRDSSGPESTGLGIPGFKATENAWNTEKQAYLDTDTDRGTDTIDENLKSYITGIEKRLKVNTHEQKDHGLGIPETQKTSSPDHLQSRDQNFINVDSVWTGKGDERRMSNSTSIKSEIRKYEGKVESSTRNSVGGLGVPQNKNTEILDTRDSVVSKVDFYDEEVEDRFGTRSHSSSKRGLGIPSYRLSGDFTSYLNPSKYLRWVVENTVGLIPTGSSTLKFLLLNEALAALVAARDLLEKKLGVALYQLPGSNEYLLANLRWAMSGVNVNTGLAKAQDLAVNLLSSKATVIDNPLNTPVPGYKDRGWYETMDGPNPASFDSIRLGGSNTNFLGNLLGGNKGLKPYKPINYLTPLLKPSPNLGLYGTISNLIGKDKVLSVSNFDSLQEAIKGSPYMTSSDKVIGTREKGVHLHEVMTLDSNHVWEIVFYPYVGAENGDCSFLPSIQQINWENYLTYGLCTNWRDWIPFTSFETTTKKMVQKNISLYSGEISIPQNLEFTNELRLVIADDQYKSWKRYFDLVLKVSSMYSNTLTDSGEVKYSNSAEYYEKKFLRYKLKNKNEIGKENTFSSNDKIRVSEGIIRPAPYKNLAFRCIIFTMDPQFQTINKLDLLVVLKEFSEEWQGEVDASPTELSLSFSIVGENPRGSSGISFMKTNQDGSISINQKKLVELKEVANQASSVSITGHIDLPLTLP